jgi:hypothetical protein
MKSIFDKEVKAEIIMRINEIKVDDTPLWGKMNPYQMLKHCRLWEEMILGKTNYKRMLLGFLFGKIALKNVLKDESPLGLNSPTVPGFAIEEKTGDFNDEKNRWLSLIDQHQIIKVTEFTHPFFGKMTREQIGTFAYKHTDHHLRQFGA